MHRVRVQSIPAFNKVLKPEGIASGTILHHQLSFCSIFPMSNPVQDSNPPGAWSSAIEEPSHAQTTVEEETRQLVDQSIRLPPRKIISVFLACCLTDVCCLLDYTSLAIALPAVAKDLNAGSTSSWIASAYYVTSSSCQLLYSHLSDVWSRKVVLLALLVIFFLGSLASSLATSAQQLIIFRAITGIGGGGLMTVAQVIVSDVVSLRQRGKYQGILVNSLSIIHICEVTIFLTKTMLFHRVLQLQFPTESDLCSEPHLPMEIVGNKLPTFRMYHETWTERRTVHIDERRWIFRINMPLAILCGLAAIFFMPLKKVSGSWKKKLGQIDFAGSALTLTSTCLFILGLTWAGVRYPWSSQQVVIPLCFSALTAGLFVIWQWKFASIPVMPLRIFTSPIVCGVLLTQAVNGWAGLSLTFYLPQFYQLIYGYSPLKSACLLIPITVSQTFTSTLSGLVITWTGNYRVSILSGWAIWTAGLSLISTLREDSNLARQLSYSILTGIGIGCTFQSSLVAIQGAVKPRDASVVTAARGFFRNLFATVGLSVSGAILAFLQNEGFEADLISEILNSPRAALEGLANQEDRRAQLLAAYRSAFRAVFLFSTGLAAMSLLCTFFFIKSKSVDRPLQEAKLQAEYQETLLRNKSETPLAVRDNKCIDAINS
ncbi:hypothetical protein PSTT_03167 [Puccinia striiformis]|uniref:Major facilitator superfamily (MFS) profile domain-containing protein n=1 Tax=Puccinia striiformis TaxID=27350 RepID=A0A2S4VX70_9BASI|nr:hypothetical protein PSTT_03167 [Puccinia striiformis]